MQRYARIFFEPTSIFVFGLNRSQSLVVSGQLPDGTVYDLTRQVRYSVRDENIVSINDGLITSRGYGHTWVKASVGHHECRALVVVHESEDKQVLDFASDIAPLFSRVGCNSGNCHGSLNGQAGFKLSLFGYDPGADYEAIAIQGEGRRIDLTDPAASLILQKPTFGIAHGGGRLFGNDSLEYRTLFEWIAAGAPRGEAGGPRLERFMVFPEGERILAGRGAEQQLVVIGKYSDGREVDMTHRVHYTSADESVASVNSDGRITAGRDGETSVMIRSVGAIGVARIAVVSRPPLAETKPAPRHNFIDDHVFDKLRRLRILPSDLCSDGEFIRRVSLDLVGTLPEAGEVRAFLADRSPDKRDRLVDRLFEHPEYADFWSLKFGDLYTNSPQFLYNGTAYFQSWLREAFARNQPYDRMVRDLVTSSGGTYQARPTNFYTVQKKPEDMATFVSQALMGVSLECARCHDHPNESWKRDDFLGLAAFFSQVKFKSGVRNNERFLYLDLKKQFQHPQTDASIWPKLLGGAWPDLEPEQDRRALLADWLTAPDNPFFAKAAVNRVWREFFGRGIVEPADDFRITNPPSHPELLDQLARDFARSGFDLHHLMRRIVRSRAYQLSSWTNPSNREDRTAFSHFYLRRLGAEQLADAISQVTQVPENYAFFPPGKRAIQLPDPIVDSYFLTIFNRSTRENATCTRKQSASVTQSLNLVSGESVNGKLRNEKGVVARMLRAGLPDRQIVEELSLAALSRYPTEREATIALQGVANSKSRREGFEDLLWALINSKEFQYQH
ncbi:MAG: DUF1553 domain-containing protein [Acidobacteriota bacterium]